MSENSNKYITRVIDQFIDATATIGDIAGTFHGDIKRDKQRFIGYAANCRVEGRISQAENFPEIVGLILSTMGGGLLGVGINIVSLGMAPITLYAVDLCTSPLELSQPQESPRLEQTTTYELPSSLEQTVSLDLIFQAKVDKELEELKAKMGIKK